MTPKRLVTSSTVAAVLMALAESASARGGSCGAFCDPFAPLIMIALAGAFFVSLAVSINKHGFCKGIFLHQGVWIISLYLGFLLTTLGFAWLAFLVFGKSGAIGIFALVSVVGIVWASKYTAKPPVRTPDQERHYLEYLERKREMETKRGVRRKSGSRR